MWAGNLDQISSRQCLAGGGNDSESQVIFPGGRIFFDVSKLIERVQDPERRRFSDLRLCADLVESQVRFRPIEYLEDFYRRAQDWHPIIGTIDIGFRSAHSFLLCRL